MRSIAVLVSGGLDSAFLVHARLSQGDRVVPVYCRCGLSWEAVELFWLRRFLRAIRSPRLHPLIIVETPVRSAYGSHWSLTGRRVPGTRSRDAAVYLPGRNLLLLSHAAVVCAQRRIGTIALGTLKGNPFADATPRFISRMARVLAEALGRPIRIIMPLRRLTKSALLRSASGAPLSLTFSCLAPRGRSHCGRCNKCAERQRAFRRAGIADPTRYVP